MLKGFANNSHSDKVKKVSVLGTNQIIEWKQTIDGLQVKVPILSGDVAVAFKIECE